ncbi:MAG: hypothetical protein LBG45_04760 [Dysgonamonadaceae bacterium]|jgi:hypothetical protein|nr:hypothetical protein [Dysgonamonadaceae bacterium]
MSTLELEVQKVNLALEILSATDEKMIKELWQFLQHQKTTSQTVCKKREIGILEGKSSFSETGDGKITAEELFGL